MKVEIDFKLRVRDFINKNLPEPLFMAYNYTVMSKNCIHSLFGYFRQYEINHAFDILPHSKKTWNIKVYGYIFLEKAKELALKIEKQFVTEVDITLMNH